MVPIAIGVAANLLPLDSDLIGFLNLVALFPFGMVVLMMVIAIQGVHGGSEWTMIVLPLVGNLLGNRWLVTKWLSKRKTAESSP